MHSFAFVSYRCAQKKQKEKKERRNNITMIVNTDNNEYFKITYKMKIMYYEIVRDGFVICNSLFYTECIFNAIWKKAFWIELNCR